MKKIFLAASATLITGLAAGAYDGPKNEWMKHIPGSTFACQVTIPGSHDSATGEGWSSSLGKTYSQAQDVSIDDQLAAGARGFDIRPGAKKNNKWVCTHGSHDTKLSLDDCFNKFVSFLNDNPSEFIVIHIYHSSSQDDSGQDWNSRFPEFLEGYRDRILNFRRDLTVDECRGKMLIFCRENYGDNIIGGIFKDELINDNGWGSWIDWTRQTNITVSGVLDGNLNRGRVFYQDLAETHEDGKIEEKINGIKQLLDFSTQYRPATPENCIWYFNFGSAYSKVQNLFGNKVSLSDGYRDNATYTNPTFIDYLKENPGPAGVVLADYICTDQSGSYNTRGAELVDVLIDNNFKYLEYVDDGVGEAVSYTPSTSTGVDVNWTFNPASTQFQGTQRSAAVMGDFSGNGRLDIISGGNGDHAKLHVNDGSWTVSSLHEQSNGLVQNKYPHYCALDFNNDGRLDLLVCGISDRSDDYVSHNAPYGKTSTGYAMTALYENTGGNTLKVVKNTGLPVIVVNKNVDSQMGGSSQPSPFAVGDFDHDGYTDIALTGREVATDQILTAVYRNNGDGTFTRFATFEPIYGNVHFADLNNDGWLDLVFDGSRDGDNGIYTGGSNMRIYLNNEGTGFEDATSQEVRLYGVRNNNSAIADFNKDGWLDFLNIGYSDQGLGFSSLFYFNNHGGNGRNSDIFITPDKHTDSWGLKTDWVENMRFVVRDINNDGNLDILFDGKENNMTYYGSEALKFRTGTILDCRGQGADDCASAFGDTDGDGIIDRYQTGWQWYTSDLMAKRHNTTGDWNWEASLYETNSCVEVPELAAPTEVYASISGDKIELTWNDIDDITAAYNVVIYNENNGTVVANIPVNAETGTLSVADGKEAAIRPGIQSYTLLMPQLKARDNEVAGLKAGVQALSLYNERASAIAWASVTTGVGAVNADNDDTKVVVYGDNIIVRTAADCNVTVIDMLGRTVATGVSNTPIAVSAKGILLVTAGSSTRKIAK